MIKPVNGHLLIEPIVHEAFISSQRETYEEIGIVIEIATDLLSDWQSLRSGNPVDHLDKVYFDSWLAARYPKEGGKPDEYYWLVKWEDIRAIEHVES